MVAVRLPRVPRERAARCAREILLVDTQLRDMAILATIALLIVLTMQILWLTDARRHRDRGR